MKFKSELALLASFLWLFFASCNTESPEKEETFPVIPVTYFETEKIPVTDNYHGEELTDNYRWLEVDTAAAVMKWVDQQNEITFGYLEQIPFRSAVRKRAEELYNYPKLSSPFKVGERYIFYKNDGLQNQAVIYIQNGLDAEPEVLIDPNSLSAAGTTSISISGISEDDRYATYNVQESGSDWVTIKVIDLETRETLSDELKWVKFSGASWKGDGFYYSRYPAPEEGTAYSNTNRFHSVYYHKLGTGQDQDVLIYRNDAEPLQYHNTSVTEDGKYLILTKSKGTDGYETWFMDLDAKDRKFQPFFTGFSQKNTIIDHRDGKFLVYTNLNAPNYRLISTDVNNVAPENWVDVIPEKGNLLNGVSTGGNKLFANYLERATSQIYVMDRDGSNVSKIQLPGLGSAGGFSGKDDDEFLFYSFSSYIYPPTIFKYDVASGNSEKFFSTDLKFNPDDFEEKQVTYKSKDGTEVSMFLVHKKNIKMDGFNPTYLYGYGGFNISLTPRFSPQYIMFAEQGGVIAIPNLRGGGEYGEEWHQAGMMEKKQNVFDDFISAAEYLIDQKYTSSNKLAIAGGSNGGLLVGACMTQRPELFAVALPAVGVLDMLRFQKFTVGWGWVVEYGSSDDAEQYKFLKAYSPYHNLKAGTKYPSTMITTADHDDRVVPAHSFKYAAALQEAHEGDNPVLIRIDKNAGHGAGKPVSKILDEQTDIWSFILYNTNSVFK